MQLSELVPAYESDGPFLTAYLAPERPDFDSSRTVELRWRALAEQLAADGADEATVSAAAGLLTGERPGQVARAGLAVVASDGAVRLDGSLHSPMGGDSARWSAIADLGPYVRANGSSRRQVLAVIDRTGADISVGDSTAMSHAELTGETWPIHKVRGAGWAQYRFDHSVEEVADRNAAMVAEEIVRRIGQVRPSVVLLAGEVEARENVRDRLPGHLADLVQVTDRGSRNDPDREALDEALAEAAWQAERRHQRDLLESFGTREANGLAVQGLADVCRAFRLGAVETLIIAVENPDAGSSAAVLRETIAVGPDPTQVAPTAEALRRELVESGADAGHDTHLTDELAESALIRAGAATGATAEVVTASAAGFADSVAALLRFELPEPTG